METKCCSKCKRDLPKDDVHFASRYDRKTKQFQNICRECQKEYRKEQYDIQYTQDQQASKPKGGDWKTNCEKCGKGPAPIGGRYCDECKRKEMERLKEEQERRKEFSNTKKTTLKKRN